jgi:Domain of unknown function (DUF4397)
LLGRRAHASSEAGWPRLLGHDDGDLTFTRQGHVATRLDVLFRRRAALIQASHHNPRAPSLADALPMKTESMLWPMSRARSRRSLFLCLAALTLALAACGGGDDERAATGNAHLRVINATADVASIDLTVDGEAGDETRAFAAVARDGQSEFALLAAGGYTLRGKRAGAAAALALNTAGLEKDKRYTAFVHGREGDHRVHAVIEDEPEPPAGKATLRVFHAAADAGPVDVYLTESGAALEDSVPHARNVVPATLSSYLAINRGAWRLRVTGQGDPRDVRLDLPALELADKARVTIVLQASAGGALVHALVSQYQGALALAKNTQARVRLAAGVAGSGVVTASVGGASVNVNLRSPSVGNYTLVPAGVVPVSVSVNGQPPIVRNTNIAVGGDFTLAAFATPDGPDWQRVLDNNQPPAQGERAKVRLLHMAPALDTMLTLSVDFVAVSQDVFLANPHLYAPVTAAARARLEVTTPLTPQPLYLNDSAAIAARGVYTLFVMEGQTQALGLLRRDR